MLSGSPKGAAWRNRRPPRSPLAARAARLGPGRDRSRPGHPASPRVGVAGAARRGKSFYALIAGVVIALAAVVTLVLVSTSGGSSGTADKNQAAVNYTTPSGVKVYGTLGPEGVPLQVGAQLAAPNTGLTGAPIAGLQCNTTEQLTYHDHAHLAIFINGQPRSIPLGVGMVPPALVQQSAQGDFATGSQTCLYWLHVHAQDGIVHIESPTPKVYELAQFFAVWHLPLTADQIGSYKGTVTRHGGRKAVDG